jgi:hypothetical protein
LLLVKELYVVGTDHDDPPCYKLPGKVGSGAARPTRHTTIAGDAGRATFLNQ